MWYLLALMLGWIFLDVILNIFPEQYIHWAVLGTMLNISPVVAIVDGEVKSVGRVKGKQKILEYTLDFANHYPVDGRHCVMFGHSRCLETMEVYRDKCVKALAIADYDWDELGAVIGTHAGPGCYGLAYIGLK